MASSATQVSQPPSPQIQRRLPSSGTAITCIAPTDISPVPEQVGRMQFDRSQYKWVKRAGEESDDPFRDFESVVDYVSSLQNREEPEHPTIVINDAAQEIEDPREEDDAAQRDSEGDVSADQSALPGAHFHATGPNQQEIQHTPLATPRLTAKAWPTPIRSALKNPNTVTATPINIRRADPGSSTGKLRSVSFSDGRHSGRIRGLHSKNPEEDSREDDPSPHSKRSLQPSFRTKRIADMLDDLDESSR